MLKFREILAFSLKWVYYDTCRRNADNQQERDRYYVFEEENCCGFHRLCDDAYHGSFRFRLHGTLCRSDLTEDGTTMFGRIEDLGTNDYNKLFNISPAGKHTAGEVYEGCYGFTYTFTHDSYRYTARRDDNGLGVCPDCDSTHEHTPYEELAPTRRASWSLPPSLSTAPTPC